jgi:hypothetical protein
MALILKDRVKETTTTTGTSSFVLGGAVTGYQDFSSAIGNANTTYYAVYLLGGTEWEVGIGTYATSGNTLARTTILASSNAGSIVTFSSGTKQIWCDYPAGKAAYQDAAGVINNGTFNATTSVITPIVQASNSGGLALKNSAGTTQISMGGGGGDNVSVNVSTNLNGVNAQIDISPTGTGHVLLKPAGTSSVEIAPTNVGTIDNMTIGATTARNGSFVDLSVTGTTSFDGNQGTAGQVLTSAGAGATPTWSTLSSGTVTSVDSTVPSIFSVSGVPITGSGTIAMTYSGTALPIANGGTNSTSTPTAGGAAYGTGTAYAVTAAGTSGQVLISNGASAPAYSANLVVSSNNVDASANTGGFIPPTGTTGQRPSSPVAGTTRYNTTLNQYEVYSGIAWIGLTSQVYTASYLMVAGGGGGGSGQTGVNQGAGGGAGGYLSGSSLSLTVGTTYTVTVGAGGAAPSSSIGSNGTDSSITGLTTAVGGGGGGYSTNGAAGGSGGGGGGIIGTGGAATSGQGSNGGNANGSSYGGGGGGAGAVGSSSNGVGGIGLQSSITGTATYYAGGGGGGFGGSGSPAGGLGGGGQGSNSGGTGQTAGTVNTGGGGGGGQGDGSSGAAGGSGVVIISVPTANYSGTTSGSPTVTTSGSNTIMTFTASGSYTA